MPPQAAFRPGLLALRPTRSSRVIYAVCAAVQIGDVNPDCSNIDSLPTITLAFGEHVLTLPPQLYVAKLKDVEEEEEVGWGVFKYPFKTGRLIEAQLVKHAVCPVRRHHPICLWTV